ncbi:nuclear transport factor 2 family protein [Aquimarina algiphila]|uniref:nuclear transport factor 2 family protein n=1 Tax=Aquimarina algiphila TaxID=2047982 RepID=UPI002331226E|nr:nuclear transport factor 2 family protein [Aquimarina algiphila]
MKPEDFITAYETALKTQEWKNIEPLFHDNVCVTFSNGTVHNGKSMVKVAFENNFSVIKNEEYSIQNVKWVLKNESIAVFLFDFFWEGVINKKYTKGNGIGTSVLINKNGKWILLTENLSKKAT